MNSDITVKPPQIESSYLPPKMDQVIKCTKLQNSSEKVQIIAKAASKIGLDLLKQTAQILPALITIPGALISYSIAGVASIIGLIFFNIKKEDEVFLPNEKVENFFFDNKRLEKQHEMGTLPEPIYQYVKDKSKDLDQTVKIREKTEKMLKKQVDKDLEGIRKKYEILIEEKEGKIKTLLYTYTKMPLGDQRDADGKIQEIKKSIETLKSDCNDECAKRNEIYKNDYKSFVSPLDKKRDEIYAGFDKERAMWKEAYNRKVYENKYDKRLKKIYNKFDTSNKEKAERLQYNLYNKYHTRVNKPEKNEETGISLVTNIKSNEALNMIYAMEKIEAEKAVWHFLDVAKIPIEQRASFIASYPGNEIVGKLQILLKASPNTDLQREYDKIDRLYKGIQSHNIQDYLKDNSSDLYGYLTKKPLRNDSYKHEDKIDLLYDLFGAHKPSKPDNRYKEMLNSKRLEIKNNLEDFEKLPARQALLSKINELLNKEGQKTIKTVEDIANVKVHSAYKNVLTEMQAQAVKLKLNNPDFKAEDLYITAEKFLEEAKTILEESKPEPA